MVQFLMLKLKRGYDRTQLAKQSLADLVRNARQHWRVSFLTAQQCRYALVLANQQVVFVGRCQAFIAPPAKICQWHIQLVPYPNSPLYNAQLSYPLTNPATRANYLQLQHAYNLVNSRQLPTTFSDDWLRGNSGK